MFCFDNCPQYQLPNVFTPGNNDQINDLYSAFHGGDGKGNTGITDNSSCARFIESVQFSVYNRWGKMIYDFESNSEKNIFIEWDGKHNDGNPVPVGVYYYIARVRFDVVNPKDAIKEIKGWVQVLR